MHTTHPPARRLHADIRTSAYDLEDLLQVEGMARFHEGTHPAAEDLDVHGTRSAEVLVPPGFRVIRRAVGDSTEHLLLEGDDATVLVSRRGNGTARCVVTATTPERVRQVAGHLRSAAGEASEGDDRIEVDFVHLGGHGARHHRRRLAGPSWDDIGRNYPRRVGLALRELCELRRPVGEARLVLWHGPPGTGKTTAARALVQAWHEWCRAVYVVDPERLFASPDYLVELLLGGQDAGDEVADDGEVPSRRWRLLIIEDADELLRVDAKETAGQALSRLLNLGDGFLGQGLELTILISTNERLDRLHPAVTRPGRCLANVHFGAFDRTEAEAWLGSDPGPGTEFSLARLYQLAGGARQVEQVARPVEHVGQYL